MPCWSCGAEVDASNIDVRVERGGASCPFCHDAIDPTKELAACAACGARHHADCATESGRCAACGSERLLVEARKGRTIERALAEPLAGSSVRVKTEGTSTTFTWPSSAKGDRFLLWLFAFLALMPPVTLFFLPVLLLILRDRRRTPELGITVGEETIDIPTQAGLRSRRLVLEKKDITRIGVATMGHAAHLFVDVGVQRHIVRAGILQPALTVPELEWLAEQLRAWHGRSSSG